MNLRGFGRRQRKMLSGLERFIQVEPNTGCWLWIGSCSTNGYAIKKINRRNYTVHRLTWEDKNGPIPAKMELDHLCRVRNCVNPSHLEPVTHLENIRRGVRATRTHCKNGHPYDTLYIRPNGYHHRGCSQCHNEANSRYRAKAAHINQEESK